MDDITGTIPFIETSRMREVDRAMLEDYRIELVQVMENGGRNLAHLARRRFLAGNPVATDIAVLVGEGSNGGSSLAAARLLHTWGAQVQVMLAQTIDDMSPVAAHQLDIASRLRIPGTATYPDSPEDNSSWDLIIDGLLGPRVRGAPRNRTNQLIGWANGQDAPILALDTPSGVDATTGNVFNPAIKASATLALALPRSGLRAPGVGKMVGELYLADIGVPPQLYAEPALRLSVGPIFAREEILRIW
jgi:NAD(P)H-hydrate epimerase